MNYKILSKDVLHGVAIRAITFLAIKSVVMYFVILAGLHHRVEILLLLGVLDAMALVYILYDVVMLNYLDNYISSSGKEAYLANKNMALLTENIHHEVKTPLVVIQSKLEELQETYQHVIYALGRPDGERRKAYRLCVDLTKEVGDDFELIHVHINAIHNVLDRMQNFKHIKYSNGNKNVYDVILASFVTLKLYSKQTFSYNIDNDLQKYHALNLRNEDILNIFMNHIKNSLEANATEIVVTLDRFDVKQGIAVIYMSDNGNGIPETAIPYIYNPQFSTKSPDGEMRGVGLYLSKAILHYNGGDEQLKETSMYGTSFKFTIPCEELSIG